MTAEDRRPDVLTLISLGLIAYAITNFLHEAIGHGGAAWLLGAKQLTVSTMNLAYEGELSPGQAKWVTASGTIVNVVAGFGLFAFLRARRMAIGWARHFTWLFMMLNLYVGGGYLLFFSFFRVGDWGRIPIGLPYEWPIRIAQSLVGLAISFFALRAGWKLLWPELEGAVDPRRRARSLCRIPYYAGIAGAVISGLPHPEAGRLLILSAVAATAGGSFWLWGMPTWNRDLPASTPAPSPFGRSVPWIAVAVVLTIVRIVTLGPGLTVSLAR